MRPGSNVREEQYKKGSNSQSVQLHPLPSNPELLNSPVRAHCVLHVTYQVFPDVEALCTGWGLGEVGDPRPVASDSKKASSLWHAVGI